MTKPTKFVARHNGQIVGTRKSPRPYTHAVITQAVEEYHRDAANLWEPGDQDKRNFEYASFVATCAAEAPVSPPGWNRTHRYSAQEIERARAEIAGDWPAYVARHKASRIAHFEDRLAKGAFEPTVGGWSMSRRNAEKMAASFKYPGVRVLAIVDAEQA